MPCIKTHTPGQSLVKSRRCLGMPICGAARQQWPAPWTADAVTEARKLDGGSRRDLHVSATVPALPSCLAEIQISAERRAVMRPQARSHASENIDAAVARLPSLHGHQQSLMQERR
ncbi:hypothetical protein BKA80DRAFT_283955 [Phyllosticta citrichinensis]